eukprot:8333312-Pyramimonas_sp.AAC.1
MFCLAFRREAVDVGGHGSRERRGRFLATVAAGALRRPLPRGQRLRGPGPAGERGRPSHAHRR